MADDANPDGVRHARLTLADQVVVNYLGFLLSQAAEGPNTTAAVDVLRPAIRQANWGNPHVEPLLRSAVELVEAFPSRKKVRGGLPWATAHLNARAALARFFFWRGALAHEALTQTTTPTQEDAA